MRARRGVLVAAIVSSGAVVAACAGDTFSGGEGDGGDAGEPRDALPSPSDGTVEGGSDGSDAGTDASGGGSDAGCAAYGAHLFCDDFERGTPAATGWSQPLSSSDGGATLVIDALGSYSPTRELTGTLAPSGGEQYSELLKSFASTNRSGVHVELSVRQDSSAGAVGVAFLRVHGSSATPYEIDVAVNGGVPTVLQRGTRDDGGVDEVPVLLPGRGPTSTWLRITLDVPFGGGQALRVTADGEMGSTTTLAEDPTKPTSVDLQIGVYDNGARPVSKVAHLDDVVFDLL